LGGIPAQATRYNTTFPLQLGLSGFRWAWELPQQCRTHP